jgi:TonB-linked SusC/RagA family outer membrane protein
MRISIGRQWQAASAALLLALASPLAAQVTITGKVTSEGSGAVGGASVTISALGLGAVASENGSYSLTIPASVAPSRQVTVTARFLGYKPATWTFTVGTSNQTHDFSLIRDPFKLDEIVTTGVGEATSLKKTTFTVGRLDEDQLKEVPGSSALVAIQGKVAAVRLVPTSSQPGGEVALRLRGATSIGGNQNPLFIVDGVITQFGLADIAPEDVERIEIIKGAAASSLYGSNGANGVVQVFTKRGATLPDGGLRVSSRVEYGTNQMPSEMEFSKSHAWQVDGSGNYILSGTGARIAEPDQIADNPFKTYLNHWDEVVTGGSYATQYVSVGQRRGATNFSSSLQNSVNQGVIFGLGGYKRQNFRLNLDQRLRNDLDASFSAFYGKSTNGRTVEGQGGPFYGLMFLQPDVDILAANPDGSPYRAQVPLSGDVANDFNPLYELANRKINNNRNRFSGSGRLRWRANDWLSMEGNLGYDQEGVSLTDATPKGYLTSSGTALGGSLNKTAETNGQFNGGATATAIREWMSGNVVSTFKVGTMFEEQTNSMLTAGAGDLIVGQVPEFSAGASTALSADSRDELIRNVNFFGLASFDVKEKYLFDGLMRRDGSSLFGKDSRWSSYFRVSGAYRLTEDIDLPGIDEMKLRASYGTAGLRPGFDDQFELWARAGDQFSKAGATLGNPKLKPAKSAELELGTQLEFGGGKYTAEYTFAQKETKDQLTLVDLLGVVGYANQWQNTGALQSTTHEATFGARLFDNGKTSFTLNVVGDKTTQKITEWALSERLYGFEQMPAAFFLGNNSSLGAIHGNHWITDVNELYDDPAKNALKGAGQAWSPDSVMINEDGYVVRKSVYGTPNERAIKYVRCTKYTNDDPSLACTNKSDIVKIGDANPDFNLSFGGTLKTGNLTVSGLLDWSHGGDLYNGTRQWAFQATRDRVQDQAGKANNDAACGTVSATMPSCPKKALAYYGVGFYNGLAPNDFFVEDGSYMKLKELSAHYNLTGAALRKVRLGGVSGMRIGLIGRNLLTFTDYSGLDPEVSGLFGDPFQVRMDWFQYPQFRTFSAVVEITF